MKNDYSIRALCEHLEVSPSGYYDWLNRRTAPGPRALANQTLVQQIRVIHSQSRQTYGSPRIVDELHKQGCHHGRNRVARLMQAAGLCGRQRRRYRVQTTDSNHDQPIAPNRLAQVPKATAPNQLWVADITYIETREGWLYLAAILDLYSRKIVGWAMSEHIDTSLVLKALAMALLHASMSRKANCYDNATMESFWSTLKLELIYRRDFATRSQARTEIFDYIEAFYNRHRAHSALDYHSPVDFETQNN
jgi:putative transposase